MCWSKRQILLAAWPKEGSFFLSWCSLIVLSLSALTLHSLSRWIECSVCTLPLKEEDYGVLHWNISSTKCSALHLSLICVQAQCSRAVADLFPRQICSYKAISGLHSWMHAAVEKRDRQNISVSFAKLMYWMASMLFVLWLYNLYESISECKLLLHSIMMDDDRWCFVMPPARGRWENQSTGTPCFFLGILSSSAFCVQRRVVIVNF